MSALAPTLPRRRLAMAAALVLLVSGALASTASASSAVLNTGSLSINAGEGETNAIDVRSDGAGNLVVTDSAGITADRGCTAVDENKVQCPEAGITRIGANLGDGDDTFTYVGPLLVHVFGATGNDTITGSAGNDLLDGGEGQDSLTGGDGDDELDGAAGSDTLDGGSGNDTLNGDTGDDSISGGGGDDTINAGADADTVGGGDGADTIYTRDSSADNVTCDAGADQVTADRLDAIDSSCEKVDAGSTSGPPGSGSGGGQNPDTTPPAVTVSARGGKAKGGVITVKVKCPASEGSCHGKVTLRSAGKVNRKVVLLGSRSFKAAGGKTAVVKIKLSAANRALLAKLGKLRVTATVVATDAAGNVKTKKKSFTVKAP